MESTSLPSIPLELVLHIVSFLAPATAIALKPSDPTAHSIRAFTLVCRAIYPTALRLLYSHCLYIDSSDRLRRLLVCLNTHLPQSFEFNNYPDGFDDTLVDGADTAPEVVANSLPEVDILPCLQNLYLAPFPERSIDDLPTAHWIFELFSITRQTLRRLVAVIPVHTLSTEADHLDVRPRLSAAFNELTAVEEFVYSDEEHLTTGHDKVVVWSNWKRLRKLAIYRIAFPIFPMDSLFPAVQALPELEHFTFLSPSPGDIHLGWEMFFAGMMQGRSRRRGGDGHDVHVLLPAVYDYGVGRCTPRGGHFHYHRERLGWARAWNAKNSYCYDNNDNNDNHRLKSRGRDAGTVEAYDGAAGARGKIDLRAIAFEVDQSGNHVRNYAWLQRWMVERGVEGTLWHPELDPTLEQSQEDQDLWVRNDSWFLGKDSSC